MLGFAIVDHQPNSNEVAVRLTSRVASTEVAHTNAVHLRDVTSDATQHKLQTLTTNRAILVTENSSLQDLPFTAPVLQPNELSTLKTETEEMQKAVIEAIADYGKDTKNRNLVRPIWPDFPKPYDQPQGASSVSRSLELANHLSHMWAAWLMTDKERAARTEHPKTGVSPWMMPSELSAKEIASLPKHFHASLTIQKTVIAGA